ncbi:hypothetical protein D9M69_528450 [compost metagenome]
MPPDPSARTSNPCLTQSSFTERRGADSGRHKKAPVFAVPGLGSGRTFAASPVPADAKHNPRDRSFLVGLRADNQKAIRSGNVATAHQRGNQYCSQVPGSTSSPRSKERSTIRTETYGTDCRPDHRDQSEPTHSGSEGHRRPALRTLPDQPYHLLALVAGTWLSCPDRICAVRPLGRGRR